MGPIIISRFPIEFDPMYLLSSPKQTLVSISQKGEIFSEAASLYLCIWIFMKLSFHNCNTQGMGCDHFLGRTHARPGLGPHAHVCAPPIWSGRTSHPHLL